MKTQLIVILSLILIIGIVALIIIFEVKKIIKKFKGSELGMIVNAASEAANYEKNEYSRQKDVNGMTVLVEPRVVEDFPDFSKEMLYSQVESDLRKIFNAIESQDISKILSQDELFLIKDEVIEKINDLKSMNKKVKYDSVSFNRHALKKYYKDSGIATIEVSSSIGYYYFESGDDNTKISKSFNNIKKQTRYTTKYSYVYDETKISDEKYILGINCPNCGAPINLLSGKVCKYCGTGIENVNLKSWRISWYKEDYN